jgi:delta 1-pyrroline-5-carboxylate dehydrogenase
LVEPEVLRNFDNLLALFRDSKDLLTSCIDLVKRIKNQTTAENIAKSNLVNHYLDKKTRLDDFIAKNKKNLLDSKKFIKDFDQNAAKLKKMPIHDQLIQGNKKYLSDYLDLSGAAKAKEIYDKNHATISQEFKATEDLVFHKIEEARSL